MFQKLPSHPSHPSHSLEWFIGLFNWHLLLNRLYINHFKGNYMVRHPYSCLDRLESHFLHHPANFNIR